MTTKALRPALFAVVVVLSASCAQRPRLITQEVAARWGCSYNAVLEAYGRLHRDLPKGQHYAPESDWSACQLLAHLGPPDSVEVDAGVAFWKYNLPGRAGRPRKTGQVLLDSLTGQGWMVGSDGW